VQTLLNVEDLAYTDDGVVDSGEGTNDEEQNVIISDQDNDNDSDSASVGTNTRRIWKVSTVSLFKKNDDLFSNNFFYQICHTLHYFST
jgi:hypothetical protein